MKITYEQLKENREIVKQMCEKYRTEMTELSAWTIKELGMVDSEDYVKYSNELTLDEIIGIYSSALLNQEIIDTYKMILSGEKTIEEHIKEVKEELSEIIE